MKTIDGYRKGINLGGWLSQCPHTTEHYDSFICEEDIKKIASWGLDHVRLPIDYNLVQTEDGHYIESGFAYIEKCIEWCIKYNLNIILDLHNAIGYAFYDQEHADKFFEDIALQQLFINLWIEFAKRFGKYEKNIAFELLNEIVSASKAQAWNDIAYHTVVCIRCLCPTIKILIGGVCYNSIGTLSLLDPPYDENIIYNFHCYEPFLFTHQGAHWIDTMPQDLHIEYPITAYDLYENVKIPKEMLGMFADQKDLKQLDISCLDALFADAYKLAKERNVALYCGEYGVIDKAPLKSTVRWFQDMHSLFEKYGIGRSCWTYKQMDFGITSEHYHEELQTIINYL